MQKISEIIEKKYKDTEGSTELKNILIDVFSKLEEYQHGVLNKVVKNVADSYTFNSQPCITTALMEKSKLMRYRGIFSPVAEETEYKASEILGLIKSEKNFVYKRCFIKLSYLDLEKLIQEDRAFCGHIVDRAGSSYRFEFRLQRNTEYIEAEKELYDLFYKNNISWRTINSPFARKMLNLSICNYLDDVSVIEDIKEINLNFEEFEDKVLLDYIPVWNVEKQEVAVHSRGQSMVPSGKNTYYKYEIPAVEELFLVDSDEVKIHSIIKEVDKVIVLTADETRPRHWKVYKFLETENSPIAEDLLFKVYSNKKTGIVSDNLNLSYKPRTLGEINKVLKSYDALDRFEVIKLKISDYPEAGEYRYQFNFFIQNQLIAYKDRKNLTLSLKLLKDDIFSLDLLSFLLSELELIYPEFVCQGVFL